jgi:uncharacterized protein (TIGR03437 family)
VKLYINDYSILSSGGGDIPHQDHYFNTIKFILDRGGPIDGIGFQGHFNMNLTPPARVLEILDRFAAFGKEMEITEHDIDISDEEIQADYLRDFLTATFSHPSIKSFLVWGFWEGAHWTPRGSLFRRNWDAKPIHRVWRDLIYNQWWTNVDGVTGADGVFRTRGFLGEYEVTVRGRTSALSLEAGTPANVTVALPVFKINAIVNAASFKSGGLAPGEIVDIWGRGFGPSDVRVLFDGTAASIIHSLPDRVAAVVPYSVVQDQTRVEVEYQGFRTNAAELPVVAAAPGIFTDASNGSGMVAGGVLLDNGSWVRIGPARWAIRGTYVCLYITGEGRIYERTPFPGPVGPVTVRFGGVASHGLDNWVGLVYNGVTQVNAYVPHSVVPGPAVPVEISVGGVPAQSGVTIPVQ